MGQLEIHININHLEIFLAVHIAIKALDKCEPVLRLYASRQQFTHTPWLFTT